MIDDDKLLTGEGISSTNPWTNSPDDDAPGFDDDIDYAVKFEDAEVDVCPRCGTIFRYGGGMGGHCGVPTIKLAQFPHGRMAGYKRGCRLPCCVAANEKRKGRSPIEQPAPPSALPVITAEMLAGKTVAEYRAEHIAELKRVALARPIERHTQK